jgi:nicotinamidase-related amidase
VSKFYIPVDLSHTALLLSNVQEQILQRFSAEITDKYLSNILSLLTLFREEISRRRNNQKENSPPTGFDNVPLIVHHVLPFGINANGFVSPYNKLSIWLKELQESGFFMSSPSDPNHPHYAIPEILKLKEGWGSKNEIILSKIQTGCFSSSDLLAYFSARGIRHVILCGLTTSGSILGSGRLGADLDFHIVMPREEVMDDEVEVSEFLLERVLPRFVDVVDTTDVEELFKWWVDKMCIYETERGEVESNSPLFKLSLLIH